MSETIGAAQVELGVDSSGVDAGVAKAKRTIDSLGGAAAKASREASQGVNEIGAAGAGAAQKMDAATKRMAESIERQALAMGKTKSEYYAAQAAIKGNEAALAPYIAKLREAEEANKKVGISMAGFNAVAIAAAAGMMARSFGNWISQTIDLADGLNDISQRTGIVVRDLVGYKLAAEQSGTSLESVGKGVKGLSTAMVEHGDSLRRAGITAKDANGALRQVADQFAQMPDGIQKSAVATKLFGKAGQDLIPLLNLGSEGLDRSARAASSYAATMEALAPQADQLNDQLAQMKMISEGFSASVASAIVPSLIQASQAFIAAKSAGEGFFRAMAEASLAAINGKSPAEVISGLRKELAAAQQVLAVPDQSTATVELYTQRIEELTKKLRTLGDLNPNVKLTGNQADVRAVDAAIAANGKGTAPGLFTGLFGGDDAKKAATEALQIQKELFTQRLDSIKQGLSAEEAAIKLSLERRQIDETEAIYAMEAVQQDAIQSRMKALAEQYAQTTDRSDRLKISGDMAKLAAESGKAFTDMQLGLEKLDIAAQKTMDTLASAAWKDAWDVGASNDKLKEESLTLGMTTEQLLAYKIEKINVAKVSAELFAKSLEDAAASIKEEGAEAERAKQYYLDLAAAKRKAAENLGEQAILTQQLETTRLQRTESIDMWKSVEGAAHETWTAVSRDGTDAFKQIGKTLKTAILDMLYQMTVKKWIFNIAGSISGADIAQSAIGSGSSGSILGTANTVANWNSTPMTSGYSNFASSQFGQKLGLSTPINGPGTIGGTDLTAMGETFKSGAEFMDAYGGYIAAFNAAANGDYGSAIGTAVGQYFGGPIGAMIGNFIGSALGLTDDSGTPHTGGFGSFSAAAGLKTGGAAAAPLGDWSGWGWNESRGDYSDAVNQASGVMAQSLAGMLDGIAASFGKSDRYAVATGFADDSSGDGAWGALKITGSNGSVLDWGAGRTSGWAPKEFADGSEGQKQYAAAIAVSVRDVIDQLDLGDWAEKILSDLGTAPTLESLGTAVGQIASIQNAFVGFGRAAESMPFANLRDLSFDTANALMKAVGGLGSLSSQLDTYYEAFYTQSERDAQAVTNLGKVFDDLGIVLPESKEAFRDLVDGLDLTTAAGQATYAAVLPLAPAFAAVADQAAAAATAWAGFDAAGLSQMMLDAAFNPQEGMIAATAFGAALEESVRTALISSTVGSIADSIFNTIVVPMAAGAAVSQIAMDGVVAHAQAAITSLAGVLAELDLSPIITALGPVISGLTTFAPRQTTSNYAAQQQAAAAAAQRAADAQLQAAAAIRDSWQGLADSMAETIRALRGEVIGPSGNFAATQAQFAIATAQARAGDQAAARQLPELAKSLVDLGKGITRTGLEQALLAAQTAASLETTVRGLGRYGITVPAFAEGTNYVPGDMLAKVHQGERIIPAADNRALLEGLTGRDVLAAKIDALCNEVARLRSDNSAENRAIAGASIKTTTALDRVINGDDAFNVRVTT